MGGQLDGYKPLMAMIVTQLIYAAMSLFTKAALSKGMSPQIFVVYRQAIATMILGPIAYFKRCRETDRPSLGLRGFGLIFLAALIGITVNQNVNYEGLFLTTAWIAVAITNLLPAVTFIMATITGMEKVNIRSVRSIAKVIGTIVCVSGAICIATFKGPELLSPSSQLVPIPPKSVFSLGGENVPIGCLFIFAGVCCWSIWLIIQVPITECYPDHLSSTAWMCFLSTLQSAVFALCMDRNVKAWIPQQNIEFVACIYSGVVGSGVSFFLQTYCISKKGPLYSAIFFPLCTVFVTIFAPLFLHEEIYLGSLIGAIALIIGLYIVLWGKAGDQGGIQKEENREEPHDLTGLRLDLEEHLLSK